MTAVRQIQESVIESSDSSDSSSTTHNNDSGLTIYKHGAFKCNNFVNKLDAYNNNQLLLPSQFYKTLLAKAVLSTNDDKSNVYKNMLFHKDREFDQVKLYVRFHFFYYASVEVVVAVVANVTMSVDYVKSVTWCRENII